MLLLIDNYDSFTYNLVHFLGELGASCDVVRNDKITVREALKAKPKAIVLSPGPCTPNEAGICLDLVKEANGKVPILGVCLGHQAIGQAYGGEVRVAGSGPSGPWRLSVDAPDPTKGPGEQAAGGEPAERSGPPAIRGRSAGAVTQPYRPHPERTSALAPGARKSFPPAGRPGDTARDGPQLHPTPRVG